MIVLFLSKSKTNQILYNPVGSQDTTIKFGKYEQAPDATN